MCSPTSPHTASSTHWPSWSQAPFWCGWPKSPDDDRAVDGAHDLAEGDLVGQACEHVPAPDASLGADEAGALQCQQDLLEVGLRKPGPLGDVPDRSR